MADDPKAHEGWLLRNDWLDDLPPKPIFPPVSTESIAANMLRESIRDGWIMGEHPVRFLRGKDHG